MLIETTEPSKAEGEATQYYWKDAPYHPTRCLEAASCEMFFEGIHTLEYILLPDFLTRVHPSQAGLACHRVCAHEYLLSGTNL
jgi:hypothetical protein